MGSSGDEDFMGAFEEASKHILSRKAAPPVQLTPSANALSHAFSSLPAHLPDQGLGSLVTTNKLIHDILPGMNQYQSGPHFFGFVTGGVTPAAQIADMLLGEYDENLTLSMPNQTVSAAVESRALEMVLDLLNIPRDVYMGRTVTTGATASNVLGMACARDHLYAQASSSKTYSYAQEGPPTNSKPIRILALHPHFSILKAAALVGIGGGPNVVKSVPAMADDELEWDLEALRAMLVEAKEAAIPVLVVYGLGEVNTGGFGRSLPEVAALSQEFDAWLHVDAAFGGFAGVVADFAHLVNGIDLADSLTLDAHKWLNVPYDCGLFYTGRASSLTDVFAPPASSAPAYLSTASSETKVDAYRNNAAGTYPTEEIINPMYLGIENSRRFRALPLFASLLSLGREGYVDIIRRNVIFARRVAHHLYHSPDYTLLNPSPGVSDIPGPFDPNHPIIPLNIVLFCPSSASRFGNGPQAAQLLTDSINSTRKIYVTGTKWRGIGATRLAVSNWQTGLREDDFDVVRDVLDSVSRPS